MNSFSKFVQKNGRQIGMILFAFMFTGLMMNSTLLEYQANLLVGTKSDAFNGTTAPVKKTPNWVDLASSEWKLPYDQIPQNKFIDLPAYVPSQLIIPMSSLNFSNTTDKAVRNAQVTYSVPYMGNYELDGREYAGSHLAVDIKIPSGTPIYAIANGIVVKATNQSGGFGYHVVLRHDDVASLTDVNVKTTYYSGYSHMSSFNVAEGQKVSKGQQIGFSGATGTATTPHLHFQIDNDQAPWHPYWPFTSKEASDAGYSFWDAINYGLGKDKALQTTISPMAYVQKYADSISSTDVALPVIPVTNVVAPVTTVDTVSPNESSSTADELPPTFTQPTEPVNLSGQPSVNIIQSVPELASLELKYNSSFKLGVEQNFKVIALDADGKIINQFQPQQDLYIKLENGSATLSKNYLSKSDFVNGVAEFSITPSAEYGIRLSVISGDIKQVSDVLQASSFSDVAETDDNFVAINFLKNNEIVRGYPDGSFKPESPVSRVEALKFIYEGLNKEVKPRVVLEFADTDSKAWYARYIDAAQKENVVKGYQGNVFKPANPVTKAEFVKMLVQAAGYNGDTYVLLHNNFSDVKQGDWYYSYVGLAKDKNIVDTSSNRFLPNEPMTRGEVAEVLYKTIMLQVSRGKAYDKGLVVNAEDVSDFYSKV